MMAVIMMNSAATVRLNDSDDGNDNTDDDHENDDHHDNDHT